MSGFDDALAALERAGVSHEIRKPLDGNELDLWLPAAENDRAARALRPLGWGRIDSPGTGHTFFVTRNENGWLKIDAKDRSARPRASRWARRFPRPGRRPGPTIAILGPDGSGKGTVIAELRRLIPLATTVVYMGRRRRPSASAPRPASSRPPSPAKESAWLVVQFLERCRRLAPAYYLARRGHIVLFDRHPLEALALEPERSRIGRSIERLLARLVPRPDAVVVLEAPTDILLERKQEHPPEVLDRWREGYRRALEPRGAVFVSSAGPREQTIAAVSQVIWDALAERRRW